MMKTLKTIRVLALLAAVGGLAAAGCQAPAPAAPPPPDYRAQLAPALDTFIEVWNDKQYDKLNGAFTENFKRVGPDFSANSRDEMIEAMRKVHEANPDLHITNNASAFDKDTGFVQWTATGTATAQDGTQTAWTINGATMLRYAGGKISEEWVYFDPSPMQPPPAQQ
jgi:hypothetical protein